MIRQEGRNSYPLFSIMSTQRTVSSSFPCINNQIVVIELLLLVAMQHLETPSGGYRTGGLGEVKYHVDYTPFTGEWGRPQPDGPASRIITLVPFTFYLWENGNEEEKKLVREKLYDGLGREETESVIKADLEYVANNWQLPGYDCACFTFFFSSFQINHN